MSDKPKQGWGWPVNSLKSHYFHEARSLCLRWGYVGLLETRETPPPDACRECEKRLAKLTVVT